MIRISMPITLSMLCMERNPNEFVGKKSIVLEDHLIEVSLQSKTTHLGVQEIFQSPLFL